METLTLGEEKERLEREKELKEQCGAQLHRVEEGSVGDTVTT